jgi:hypothetical protein
MKAVTLYVLTAVVTGLYDFYRLMETVNGAPLPLLNLVAILGSGTLVGAAILVPFQPRVAGRVGLAGSLLSWAFYAPLLVVGSLMPFTFWTSIRSDFSSREYIPLVGVILGPMLLAACTVNSILSSRRHLQSADALRR